MTAPSLVGSIQTINSNGQSGSQSVTVPAGADLCLLCAAYYDDAATGGINTASLNGSSFTSVAEIFNNTNYGGTTIWRLNNPASGTFSWSWDMTFASNYENAVMFLVFLQDVDTSGNPIRSSATGQGASTATSGSFSSNTNDLCVCAGYSYDTDCNAAAGTNQTERANGNNAEDNGAIGTKPGVSGTTTMAVSGSGCSICAVSVLGTPDGTQYTQSVSGVVSPAGAILKQDRKPLAGAISPAGAISKRAFRLLAGAISPSGTLSAIKSVLLSLGGAISPGGVLTRRTAKSLSGILGPAGAIVKRINRTLGGTLTFKGGYCLRFYGNGTGNIDRVRIPLDTGGTSTPVDVGAGDFTIEAWIKFDQADNTADITGGGDSRNSNIFWDRDIWGHPRGWTVGLTRSGSNTFVCFGMAESGGGWATIIGTTNVGDGGWHHVAITFQQSTRRITLWVDGSQNNTRIYDQSDLSYPDGYDPGTGQNNPYLVLGAEKHDAGGSYPSYNGYMDELRISDARRYTAAFTPQTSQFGPDANTMGLYHFNETAGTVLRDSATVAGAPTNGELLVGGSPSGPVWAASNVFRSLTIVKILLVVLSGAIGPSGTLTKRTSRALSGAIGPAGAVLKRTFKSFTGAIAPSGALSIVKAFSVLLAGAISPSGAATKRINKPLAGVMGPAGNLVKQITRSLAGAITPTGSLSTVRAFLISLVGSISLSGALVKRTLKGLSGTISPNGSVIKRIARTLAGAISPGGTLGAVRVILRSVGGAISPAGMIAKRALKGLNGSILPAGQVSKLTSTTLTGAIAPIGAITKQVRKTISGILSFLGSVVGIPVVYRVQLHLKERTVLFALKDRPTSLTLQDLS